MEILEISPIQTVVGKNKTTKNRKSTQSTYLLKLNNKQFSYNTNRGQQAGKGCHPPELGDSLVKLEINCKEKLSGKQEKGIWSGCILFIPYCAKDQVSIVQGNNPNLGYFPNNYDLQSMLLTLDITLTDLMSLQTVNSLSN